MTTTEPALTGLTDRTAIVTGGAGEIGRAIALELAASNLDVAIFDVDAAGARRTGKRIRKLGRQTVVRQVDVADEAAVVDAIDDVTTKLGTVSLLVNNAGVQIPALVVDTTIDDWDFQFDVNAKGTFLCTKHFANRLIEVDTPGTVVNVASQVGKLPPAKLPAYSASKAAVINFTKVAAQELAAHSIRVNAVCPGSIETDLLARWASDSTAGDESAFYDTLRSDVIPLGRIGRPKDVADLVTFLASDRSAFITGQSISVTGGETLL